MLYKKEYVTMTIEPGDAYCMHEWVTNKDTAPTMNSYKRICNFCGRIEEWTEINVPYENNQTFDEVYEDFYG